MLLFLRIWYCKYLITVIISCKIASENVKVGDPKVSFSLSIDQKCQQSLIFFTSIFSKSSPQSFPGKSLRVIFDDFYDMMTNLFSIQMKPFCLNKAYIKEFLLQRHQNQCEKKSIVSYCSSLKTFISNLFMIGWLSVAYLDVFYSTWTPHKFGFSKFAHPI